MDLLHSKLFKFFAITVSLLLLIGNSKAASFDCMKATTAQEKAICSTPTLSALDEELAKTYKSARTTSQDVDKLKSEQIAWIKETRKCQSDVSCIERLYTARLAELNPPAVKPTQEPITAPTSESTAAQPAVVQPDSTNSQTTANTMAAEPAAPAASAAPSATAPTTSETRVVNVESKPSMSSNNESQFYWLIAGGLIIVLISIYFIVKKITPSRKRISVESTPPTAIESLKNSENDEIIKPTIDLAKKVTSQSTENKEKMHLETPVDINLKSSPWITRIVTHIRLMVCMTMKKITNLIFDIWKTNPLSAIIICISIPLIIVVSFSLLFRVINGEENVFLKSDAELNAMKKKEEWEILCWRYEQARQECAVASNPAQCIKTKTDYEIYVLGSANCIGKYPTYPGYKK